MFAMPNNGPRGRRQGDTMSENTINGTFDITSAADIGKLLASLTPEQIAQALAAMGSKIHDVKKVASDASKAARDAERAAALTKWNAVRELIADTVATAAETFNAFRYLSIRVKRVDGRYETNVNFVTASGTRWQDGPEADEADRADKAEQTAETQAEIDASEQRTIDQKAADALAEAEASKADSEANEAEAPATAVNA
jgi:hypothetical protein